uniref:DUF202 domain-containing protein n=1 Tax=Loa loa TaxID=7209 RepID=A0A1I7VXC5_LOALO
MPNGHFTACCKIHVHAHYELLDDHTWHSISMEHTDRLDTNTALAILIWLSGTIVLFTTALFSTQTFLDTFGQGHQQQFITRFLVVLMIKTAIILVGLYLAYQLFVFNQCRKYFDHVRNADLPRALQEEATELEVIKNKS